MGVDLGLTTTAPKYLVITKQWGAEPNPEDAPPIPWTEKKRFLGCKCLRTGAVAYGTIEEIAVIVGIKLRTLKNKVYRKLPISGYFVYWIDRATFVRKTGRKYR